MGLLRRSYLVEENEQLIPDSVYWCFLISDIYVAFVRKRCRAGVLNACTGVSSLFTGYQVMIFFAFVRRKVDDWKTFLCQPG